MTTVRITDDVTGIVLIDQDANLASPFEVVAEAVKKSVGGPVRLQIFDRDGVCTTNELMLPPAPS